MGFNRFRISFGIFIILFFEATTKNNTVEFDKCQNCKIFTDSFNYWFEKTSRGHYDGGDTAWEEVNLKSYAKSEMRLVEIQEALCSELKKRSDQCYLLVEDSEHLLEKWWSLDDTNTIDLYTWLCIENLMYCCPSNSFGESCMPCPIDNEKKVCGSHGNCDGEGTRKGNGTCICEDGYTGEFCNDCTKDYYNTKNGFCKPCHNACNGCVGKGPNSCISCNLGWKFESNTCTDIDECLNPTTCDIGEFCVNHEGTYTCNKCDKSCKTCIGAGESNCTSCTPNNKLWSGMCVDSKLKSEIITSALRRMTIYLVLLLIILIVYNYSIPLATTIVLIVAYYMFKSELSSQMSLIDVIINLYFLK